MLRIILLDVTCIVIIIIVSKRVINHSVVHYVFLKVLSLSIHFFAYFVSESNFGKKRPKRVRLYTL